MRSASIQRLRWVVTLAALGLLSSPASANPRCEHLGNDVICPDGVPAGSVSFQFIPGGIQWQTPDNNFVNSSGQNPAPFVPCPPGMEQNGSIDRAFERIGLTHDNPEFPSEMGPPDFSVGLYLFSGAGLADILSGQGLPPEVLDFIGSGGSASPFGPDFPFGPGGPVGPNGAPTPTGEALSSPVVTTTLNPGSTPILSPADRIRENANWSDVWADFDRNAADGWRKDAENRRRQAEEYRKLARNAREYADEASDPEDADDWRERAEEHERNAERLEEGADRSADRAEEYEDKAEQHEQDAETAREEAERLEREWEEAQREFEQQQREEAERRAEAERERQAREEAERERQRVERLRNMTQEEARAEGVLDEWREQDLKDAQERYEKIQDLKERERQFFEEQEQRRAREAAERQRRYEDMLEREKQYFQEQEQRAREAAQREQAEQERRAAMNSRMNWAQFNNIRGKAQGYVISLGEQADVLPQQTGRVLGGVNKVNSIRKFGNAAQEVVDEGLTRSQILEQMIESDDFDPEAFQRAQNELFFDSAGKLVGAAPLPTP